MSGELNPGTPEINRGPRDVNTVAAAAGELVTSGVPVDYDSLFSPDGNPNASVEAAAVRPERGGRADSGIQEDRRPGPGQTWADIQTPTAAAEVRPTRGEVSAAVTRSRGGVPPTEEELKYIMEAQSKGTWTGA